MKKPQEKAANFWEKLVKRAWESVRRNREFQEDCQAVTQGHNPDRIVEKWGVTCLNAEQNYEQVKQSFPPLPEGQFRPSISEAFYEIYLRLARRGDSRDLTQVVYCQELMGLLQEMESVCGCPYPEVPKDKQVEIVKTGQSPLPKFAHFQIDVEADPDRIVQDVIHDIVYMRYFQQVRGQTVNPFKARTWKKWIRVLNRPLDPYEGTRYDFGKDDVVFQVWDLVLQGRTDTAIAQELWPTDVAKGKGRDTKTGEKGPLTQRVHDYKRRAEGWIEHYPSLIRREISVQ